MLIGVEVDVILALMIILSQAYTSGGNRKRSDLDIWSAERQMKEIVVALNGPKPTTRQPGESVPTIVRLPLTAKEVEMRTLVKRWMDSGPNLMKLFSEEPQLADLFKNGEIVIHAGPEGRGYLDWTPRKLALHKSSPAGELTIHYDEVLEQFGALITNPEWSLLRGPCPNCSDYFLKDSDRPRVYCSRTCSSAATAKVSVQRTREKSHAEKVKRAQASILEFGKAKRRMHWKNWVSGKTMISTRWLTRAANNGDLQEPPNR